MSKNVTKLNLTKPIDGSMMTTPIRRRTFAALVALVAAAAALFAFASSHATTANGAALKPASTGAGETLLNG